MRVKKHGSHFFWAEKGGIKVKSRPNVELREALRKRGITQRVLSVESGVSENLISLACKHGLATVTVRRRIAEYLGVKEADVFPILEKK